MTSNKTITAYLVVTYFYVPKRRKREKLHPYAPDEYSLRDRVGDFWCAESMNTGTMQTYHRNPTEMLGQDGIFVLTKKKEEKLDQLCDNLRFVIECQFRLNYGDEGDLAHLGDWRFFNYLKNTARWALHKAMHRRIWRSWLPLEEIEKRYGVLLHHTSCWSLRWLRNKYNLDVFDTGGLVAGFLHTPGKLDEQTSYLMHDARQQNTGKKDAEGMKRNVRTFYFDQSRIVAQAEFNIDVSASVQNIKDDIKEDRESSLQREIEPLFGAANYELTPSRLWITWQQNLTDLLLHFDSMMIGSDEGGRGESLLMKFLHNRQHPFRVSFVGVDTKEQEKNPPDWVGREYISSQEAKHGGDMVSPFGYSIWLREFEWTKFNKVLDYCKNENIIINTSDRFIVFLQWLEYKKHCNAIEKQPPPQLLLFQEDDYLSSSYSIPN